MEKMLRFFQLLLEYQRLKYDLKCHYELLKSDLKIKFEETKHRLSKLNNI